MCVVLVHRTRFYTNEKSLYKGEFLSTFIETNLRPISWFYGLLSYFLLF